MHLYRDNQMSVGANTMQGAKDKNVYNNILFAFRLNTQQGWG